MGDLRHVLTGLCGTVDQDKKMPLHDTVSVALKLGTAKGFAGPGEAAEAGHL